MVTKVNDSTEKIIINGQVRNASEYDQYESPVKAYVYDVIRVIDGRPLFAAEHYSRIVNSLAATGDAPDFSLPEMCMCIEMLVQANCVRNDNVKIIVDIDNGEQNSYMLLTHSRYPDEAAYRDGVDTGLFSAVRINPNIKSRNQALRDATNQAIKSGGLFEVILVDEQGCITEGSRSNIFFIKDGTVYTCHESGVLPGITRQKIIQICREKQIEVIERYIPASTLKDYDAAFISGTSPKVLPIRRIGDVKLDVNDDTLRKIMQLYDIEIEKS